MFTTMQAYQSSYDYRSSILLSHNAKTEVVCVLIVKWSVTEWVLLCREDSVIVRAKNCPEGS